MRVIIKRKPEIEIKVTCSHCEAVLGVLESDGIPVTTCDGSFIRTTCPECSNVLFIDKTSWSNVQR